MQPMFKTRMLIDQSKAKLDEKIFFGDITHLLEPSIRRMLISGLYVGTRISHCILVHNLLATDL